MPPSRLQQRRLAKARAANTTETSGARVIRILVAFANSPFGLFLASSVALAMIVKVFQDRDAEIKYKVELVKEISSAQLEIAFRQSQFTRLTRSTLFDSTDCRLMISIFQGRPPFIPTSKEFDGVSLPAIVHKFGPPLEPDLVFHDILRGNVLLREEGWRRNLAIASEEPRRALLEISGLVAQADSANCEPAIHSIASELAASLGQISIQGLLPPHPDRPRRTVIGN